MKDAYYFPHDTNAMQDPKMMRVVSLHGLMGVGAYWAIIELLHQQDTGKIAEVELDACLDFYAEFERTKTGDRGNLSTIKDSLTAIGLLQKDGDTYFSGRVLRNKQLRAAMSEKRSLAGKRGAEAKWHPNENLANGWQMDGKAKAVIDGKMANDGKGKESKGKEIKGKEKKGYYAEFEAFWAGYPKKVGKDATAKVWKAKTPDLQVCLTALTWQTKQESWTREGGKYIPHPSTWLNQGRWADEPTTAKTGSSAGPIAGKYDGYGEKV